MASVDLPPDNSSDHTYCLSKTQTLVYNDESHNSQSISSTRDLKKQDEIIWKRFKLKIDKVDGGFVCNGCLRVFPSEISARSHVRNPMCVSKKKNKKQKKIVCQEDGCSFECSKIKENVSQSIFPLFSWPKGPSSIHCVGH